MDKSLENKRQAVEPYEPVCLVNVNFELVIELLLLTKKEN